MTDAETMRAVRELISRLEATERPSLRVVLTMLLKQGEITMATLAEVQAKVIDLQDTLDQEQEQKAAADAALLAEIQSLKDIIAAGSGPTPEQLDELVASLEAIRVDLAATVPDAPPAPVDPNALPMGFSASGTVSDAPPA